jgi:hypothetical protein
MHAVAVYREHLAPTVAEGEQVAADPATQVGQPGPVRVAAGAMARGQLRGRLLEPRPGEEHLRGPAEPLARRDPQLVLGERCRGQFGRIAPAQVGGQPQDRVGGGLLRRQAVEELAALRGHQHGQLLVRLVGQRRHALSALGGG